MSPIPPNKNAEYPDINQDDATDPENQLEHVTTSPEATETQQEWDPNYYNVNYSGVTYQQLSQSNPGNHNEDESDDDSISNPELTEIDPDVEFEILASSRTCEDKTKMNNGVPQTMHLLEKDVFEKKVELQCEEIPLDDSKSKTINNLMSSFKLPDTCVPEWAKNIPEDTWKKNLIESLNAKKNDLFQ